MTNEHPPTIADIRRRRQTSPILRITYRLSIGGAFANAEQFLYGMDLETRSNGETWVRRCGNIGWTHLHGEVLEFEEISDDEYRSVLESAPAVIVPKYGNTYRGHVVEVNRSRVVVRFLTRAGVEKRFAFPIRQVGVTR